MYLAHNGIKCGPGIRNVRGAWGGCHVAPHSVSVNNLPCFYVQADLQLLNENGGGTTTTVADASEAILSRL